MPPLSRPAVLGLIGNTPLLEVTRLDTGICQLFLKLESQNPGGSIKDRIGLSINNPLARKSGHRWGIRSIPSWSVSAPPARLPD